MSSNFKLMLPMSASKCDLI